MLLADCLDEAPEEPPVGALSSFGFSSLVLGGRGGAAAANPAASPAAVIGASA